jgi:outer membrane murein-binding lipoprotein Lpp
MRGAPDGEEAVDPTDAAVPSEGARGGEAAGPLRGDPGIGDPASSAPTEDVPSAPVPADRIRRDRSARRTARAPRRRRRRRVLVPLLVLLGVLLLAGGWLGFRVWQAAEAARDLRAAVEGAGAEVEALDADALTARLPAVQDAAARLSDASTDPLWSLAEHLPGVGDDLRAVRAVGAAADGLSHDVAPGLLATLDDLGSTATTSAGASAADVPAGWVDLSVLLRAAPEVQRAVQEATTLRDARDGIDPDGLVGPLADPVARVQEGLAGIDLDGLGALAAAAPGLLGADGPRTYLLLTLNPAELRAQGGIVGSVAVLQVRDGAVGLVGQRSTADLPERTTSVLPLTDAETTLYTDRLGRWIQDTVLTPDFPRAAEVAAAFWADATGQQVDGVLATDPVAVADLLAATGRGLDVDGQQITADTLLATLLRDTYLDNGDPRDGDAFYARVAAAVVGMLGDAASDPATARPAVQAVAASVQQGRVRAWSAHPDEQAALAASPVGAAFLSASDDATADAVGLFLDDGTAGKLDYDLDATVSVALTGCGTDAPVATVTLDLAYDPPADVADLPAQVVGDGGSGLPAGWLATNVSVYSARGGTPLEVRRDGVVVGGLLATVGERSAMVLTSRLAPGAHETWTVTVPAPSGALTVRTTPTLTGPGSVSGSCTDAQG